MKKVFIAGGGTGGHFYPALSLAEYLHEKDFSITYIGAKRGIEGKKEFPFGDKILLDIKGVRGKGLFGKVSSALGLIKNSLYVRKILKKEKPDFVLCFGGYASLPLGLAAALSNIPLYIHEQNSVPSYTNKLLSFFSKKIFITFEYSKRFFLKRKTLLTGMPLRKTLKERLDITKEEARKEIGLDINRKTILIFGGSQGAKKLTEIALKAAEKLPDISFILITGKNSDVEKPSKNMIVYKYFEDIGLLYKACDVVVSRAGAGTVSEVLLFGKYTIFIPYPYAASNHQYFNVKWLAEQKLADILEEKDLTEDIFLEKLEKALKIFKEKEEKIKNLGISNAEERIFENIDEAQGYR